MMNLVLKRGLTASLNRQNAAIAVGATAATACLYYQITSANNRNDIISRSIKKSFTNRHEVLCHSISVETLEARGVSVCPMPNTTESSNVKVISSNQDSASNDETDTTIDSSSGSDAPKPCSHSRACAPPSRAQH